MRKKICLNEYERHLKSNDMSHSKILTALQTTYAASLLFIPAIVVIKLSIVLLLRALVPVTIHRRIGIVFGVGVITWGVSSEFAAAFQCRPPRTWQSEGNQCFSRVSRSMFNAKGPRLTWS